MQFPLFLLDSDGSKTKLLKIARHQTNVALPSNRKNNYWNVSTNVSFIYAVMYRSTMYIFIVEVKIKL